MRSPGSRPPTSRRKTIGGERRHVTWREAGHPHDLGFVRQFGPHLDRVVSMFTSFGRTVTGGNIGWSGREPADAEPRVDRYSQITVRTNRYSVPVHLVGRQVPVHLHACHLV